MRWGDDRGDIGEVKRGLRREEKVVGRGDEIRKEGRGGEKGKRNDIMKIHSYLTHLHS